MSSPRTILTSTLAVLGSAALAGSALAVSQPAERVADTVPDRSETMLVQLPALPDLPGAAADAARSALESALDRAAIALAEAPGAENGGGGATVPELPELPDDASDQARDALTDAQDLIGQDGSPGASGDHTPDNPHIPDNPGNPNQ